MHRTRREQPKGIWGGWSTRTTLLCPLSSLPCQHLCKSANPRQPAPLPPCLWGCLMPPTSCPEAPSRKPCLLPCHEWWEPAPRTGWAGGWVSVLQQPCNRPLLLSPPFQTPWLCASCTPDCDTFLPAPRPGQPPHQLSCAAQSLPELMEDSSVLWKRVSLGVRPTGLRS